MTSEIERKFLLPELPEFATSLRFTDISQGYLHLGEDSEIRIRKKAKRYFQTIKKGSGLSREETEIILNRKQFLNLWKLTEGARIEKTRASLDYQGHLMEFDIFQGNLNGLKMVEIEFKDQQAAAEFEVPAWMGPEVTYDPRFKNRELATSPIKPDEIPFKIEEEKDKYVVGSILALHKKGKWNVVTITSKNKQRVIFPKGQSEENMSAPEVARMEAIEEAGAEGQVWGNPIMIPYETESVTNWLLFPIEVRKLNRSWEEKSIRSRSVTPIETAIERPDFDYIHTAIEHLQLLLRGKKNQEFASVSS